MSEKKPITKKWWFWVLVAIVVIILLPSLFGDKDEDVSNDTSPAPVEANATPEVNPEPTPTPEPTPEPTPVVPVYWEGMYKIGEDMAPGEYKLFSSSAFGAYFEVASDSSGEVESIIANDNFDSFTYITVSQGQYLTLNDAKAIAVADVSPYELTDNTYIQGMYLVGFDIPAGEYEVTASESTGGYWERSADSSHSFDSIIANDNFDSTCYVTINDGEYFKLSNAYIEVN